jgi:hypothetical protein
MADEWERGQGGGQRAREWFHGNRSNWLRGLLMLAFFVVFGLVKALVGLMALFQFGSLLVAGQPNPRLVRFGASLAVYNRELVEYLVCAREAPPFPFSDWPPPDP